ncbi:MAG: aspartate-alanine antiporter [Bacteroidales bacterium]|nr:aspartate-alanine antiporter [Bacteroidales bacterium]
MDYILDILRANPALALFLTVGLGFFFGKLKYKNFSLGPVTAVLIIGVLVGQLGITLSNDLKTVFFMLFLFSIGYSVGPQFFRSLKGMGLKMVLFAVLMGSTSFLSVFLLAKWLGYNAGETVGFFGGSQTCSSLLAVGGDAINNMNVGADEKQTMLNLMPVCYAVTYVFGTLGTVILLGTLGPTLLGGLDKVKRQTAELEAEMNEATWKSDPVNISALRTIAFRTFKVEQPYFAGGRAVATVEHFLRATGRVLYVDRIRRTDGTIEVAESDSIIRQGDTVVICGRRQFLMTHTGYFGPEINDPELLEYPVERVPVLVVGRKMAGMTIGKLRDLPEMRGVMIEELQRKDGQIEVADDTPLEKGDTLVLVGRKNSLRKVSRMIGYVDVPTSKSDIMFLGLAIFIGAFLGAIPLIIDGIPISFGLSGGSLIAGLVFGWLRTRRPTMGYIPPAALWLMNNLGLNVFIAVVGINAAPTFVSGVRSVGFGLLGAGAVATLIPLCIGLLLGKYVFRFNPAITLGCTAGTRTCTASLGAVQETLGSTLPTMGYTVTYAVSNVLLVIWGIVTVALV